MTTRQIWILFKDRKLLASILFIFFGLLFSCFYLLKDEVRTKSDLVEINVNLSNFSFIEHNGAKKSIFEYYLYFSGYNNKFQIIADFLEYFDKDFFERNIKIGDDIRIYIPLNDFNNIKNQDKVKLFGIHGKSMIFLDCQSTIDKYNSELPIGFGLIFIILGGLIFYFNKEKLNLVEE